MTPYEKKEDGEYEEIEILLGKYRLNFGKSRQLA